MNKRKFSKTRKAAIAALCAVAVTCTGIAAACSTDNPGNSGSSSTPKKEDTQLLKNGDFEFFDVPENAVHLIKNVNNWSRSGDSSQTKSGIINTSAKSWEKFTDYDYDLKGLLDKNNDLHVGDSDYEDKYVDYNGMKSSDIPYIDPYVAALAAEKIGDSTDGYAKDGVILGGGKQAERSYREFLGIIKEGDGEEAKYYFREVKDENEVFLNEDDGDYYFDKDYVHSVRYAVIDNPETHYGEMVEGNTYTVDGEEYKLLIDEDTGDYYFDVDGDGEIDKLKDKSVGNVLMIHNYPTNSRYNGIEQHYTSHSITLEANTAAEISLWVKTSDLKFDKGYILDENEQDRGAYIEVAQTVANTAIDSFKIKAINTQKIISNAKISNTDLGENENNGWLKYTIYVNACDFASSTITISLGLGDTDTTKKVTGYAFFDDVSVKKYIDLENDKDSTFDEDNIWPAGEDASYCSLKSEDEEKVFYADKEVRGGSNKRFSNRFHYLVDLASEIYNEVTLKKAIAFGSSDLSVTTALTTTESSGKRYSSALNNYANLFGVTSSDEAGYVLPESMKYEGGRPTFNDLIGIYDASKEFALSDFNGNVSHKEREDLDVYDASSWLNAALSGESGLAAIAPFCIADSHSMLVTFSAYGAAYTTTIENAQNKTLFTVDGSDDSEDNYKILSFWVKTSDMDGSTAATIKIIDTTDKDNYATITVDTTDIKTEIGDDEDIYDGWVQCFFFVKNELKDNKSFKLEFSFGNTDISKTSGTSYTSGWAAMANLQALDVDEDVFKIVTESTYAKILTFSEEDKKVNTPFDDANRMTSVKKGIANPTSYYGVNGTSSYVSDKEFCDDFDKQNNNAFAGLINKEYFENYENFETIANAFGSFTEAAKAWNDIFGDDCYQPLIIVDSLRTYYDRAIQDAAYIEAHITDFYYRDENGVYTQATEYDPEETYYTLREVKNFGFIGNNNSISSDNYVTISVRVMVSGENTSAWIYLVDTKDYDVLSFDIPNYTYYYDEKGNVLDEEYDGDWTDVKHRSHIVYTLRTDGLYDGKDGGVYANLSNLTKRYKYAKLFKNRDEKLLYNADNEVVYYDELEDGVTYYYENGKEANHYLVVDEQRVYEFDSSVGENGAYYYLVNGERSVAVKDFSHDYARYESFAAGEKEAPKYAIEVTDTDGQWVNVNFIIATGEDIKNYRLELWSGKRDEDGVLSGMTKSSVDGKGGVAFDYSDYNISENEYSNVLSHYETEIKNAYRKLILGTEGGVDEFDKKEKNINELKAIVDRLLEEGKLEQSAIDKAFEGIDKDYVAEYYTYTWYDSAKYVPFNFNTAKTGQTGYSYKANSDSETLVYFKTRDYSDNSYNVFVNYSAIDKTYEVATDNNSGEGNHGHDSGNKGESPWLLITAIVLVAVLLFVLIAILVRYLWRKYAKKRDMKNMQKNNYKQRERYIRKLKLVKNEPDEEEAPVEETPSEETPVEETPAEEVPADEAPIGEAPVEEAPAEDENKDE